MLDRIFDNPNLCYGCGACVESCPTRCIEITKNEYGFTQINIPNKDKCLNCGKCERACQVYGKEKNNDLKKRYYAQNKDKDILKKSSSGGMINAFSSYVLRQGGVVWGVRYNFNNDKSEFYCVRDINNLQLILGSKYMEVSEPAPYGVIENQLKSNILVLFTGLPCQVVGLKKFLGKVYDNLITIDLLCYGVQSPIVWRQYLKEINLNNRKVVDISFREKKPRWENYEIKILYEDGTYYEGNRWRDPYLLSYATPYFTRESCKMCEAKKFPRSSDITIGDFWQIDTVNMVSKDININNGVSVVLVHSPKGEEILSFSSDELKLFEIPENAFINMYERYSKNAERPENTDAFFTEVFNSGFSSAVNKYIKPNYYEKRRLEWLRYKRIIKRYCRPLFIIINKLRGKG